MSGEGGISKKTFLSFVFRQFRQWGVSWKYIVAGSRKSIAANRAKADFAGAYDSWRRE